MSDEHGGSVPANPVQPSQSVPQEKFPEPIVESVLCERGLSSSQIDKLFEALAKAQGEIENAKKNRTNPHFESAFADLSAIRDVIRGPMSKHGLSYVQLIQPGKDGMRLVTILGHSSGQWMSSTMPIQPDRKGAQGLGSELTYMRRYALSAIIGAASDEDDDGNHAQESAEQGGKATSAEKPAKGNDKSPSGPSGPQVKRLYAIGRNAGWDSGQIREYCQKKFKAKETELSRQDYDVICKYLEGKPDAPAAAPAPGGDLRNKFKTLTDLMKRRSWEPSHAADVSNGLFGTPSAQELSMEQLDELIQFVHKYTPKQAADEVLRRQAEKFSKETDADATPMDEPADEDEKAFSDFVQKGEL